jgi:hypothetical protein
MRQRAKTISTIAQIRALIQDNMLILGNTSTGSIPWETFQIKTLLKTITGCFQ